MANITLSHLTGNTSYTTILSNESDTEASAAPLDIMNIIWLRAIFIFLYCLIFIIGASGNCLVVYVVVRNSSMQTITNIFITNLALSDIMMCLLAVPFTPLSAFMKEWLFGEVMCHILPMTLCVSVYVSTLTSTAIAVDRYFVIVHPFKPRVKPCVCLLLIVAIWIISISISLPLGIYQKVMDDKGTHMCTELWPKPTARQFFTVTSLILQYIVPCSIITYCYMKVSLFLSNRSRSRIGTGCRNRDRDEMEIRRKKRTNKMLIAMISIFVVCWLPLNVVHTSAEYRKSFNEWQFFYLIFFLAHVIAMSSTVYNPFLYAWMNENFRKEFKTVLPALFFRSSRHCYNGNSDATQYTTVETNPDCRKDVKPDLLKSEKTTESNHINGNGRADVQCEVNQNCNVSVDINGAAGEKIELNTLDVKQNAQNV